MAAVLILSADLMFGSRLLSSLADAGHTPELIASAGAFRERLRPGSQPRPEVLIFDLTDERLDGASTLEEIRAEGLLGSLPTLAFYSHVETTVRERAQTAGFGLVVPRSRMAREAAAVLDGLAVD